MYLGRYVVEESGLPLLELFLQEMQRSVRITYFSMLDIAVTVHTGAVNYYDL